MCTWHLLKKRSLLSKVANKTLLAQIQWPFLKSLSLNTILWHPIGRSACSLLPTKTTCCCVILCFSGGTFLLAGFLKGPLASPPPSHATCFIISLPFPQIFQKELSTEHLKELWKKTHNFYGLHWLSYVTFFTHSVSGFLIKVIRQKDLYIF